MKILIKKKKRKDVTNDQGFPSLHQGVKLQWKQHKKELRSANI